MSAFEVVRSVSVQADPDRIHGLVDDFHQWPAWSPWEGIDPDMERTYAGPAAGVGSSYAWRGNRKAGTGSMAITAVTPEQVAVDLHFEKPFKADNKVTFELRPVADGTEVTWRMVGENAGVWGAVSKLFGLMDRLVGKDFDKGLARLKAVAEESPAP